MRVDRSQVQIRRPFLLPPCKKNPFLAITLNNPQPARFRRDPLAVKIRTVDPPGWFTFAGDLQE
ncbi:MAG: hypothetical protein EA424_17115 [Planctomycetaceae bacterium]|nr:MAG: hypothetical protein EA424_17115 [Planctomycetaceae bacterium]